MSHPGDLRRDWLLYGARVSETIWLALIYGSLLVIPWLWFCHFLMHPWPAGEFPIVYLLNVIIEEVAHMPRAPAWEAPPKRKTRKRRKAK